MIKKVFAVLAVCFIFTAFAVSAFAAEETSESDFKYSVQDGGVTINKYTGSDTEIIIPAQIEGKPVREIAGSAFENCTAITSIEIPDGVVHIGFLSFRHCEALKSVKITDSVVF
ncbi:MAG: leucine-rich repeat domain-containing protein, partial [Oscillospiraceae bacterium]|nr:leucine-rich repeat domain-containing protein [Oscillospiraceae bacterium]